MKSTYINDTADSSYPFMATNCLPFPNSCITGMGICLYMRNEHVAPAFLAVSGVEIADGYIAITVIDDAGNYILDIHAYRNGLAGTAHAITDTCEAYGWLALGVIPADVVTGTYTGIYKIDPSCVNVITTDMYGYADAINVNQAVYNVSRNLGLRFAGYFDTAVIRTISSTVVNVKASPPESAVLSLQTTADNYQMVTSLQGHSVTCDQPAHGTLTLHAESGISMHVQNATYTADMNNSLAESKSANSVIITIIGDHTFPNCYADDEDEA